MLNAHNLKALRTFHIKKSTLMMGAHNQVFDQNVVLSIEIKPPIGCLITRLIKQTFGLTKYSFLPDYVRFHDRNLF